MAQASRLPKAKVSRKRPKQHSQQSRIPIEAGPLWTHRQRQMHSLHYAVSYRASFKPELPDFFIRRFLGDRTAAVVLDPFGGRGTTALQANLSGYSAIHNDVNPVASFLCSARAAVPPLEELERVLAELPLPGRARITKDEKQRLLPFFHPRTLAEIVELRRLVRPHRDQGDPALRYIGLTALSRLYGHSDGFFSVYTFPQISIMPGAQRRNNLRRGQKPEYKPVRERIARKMRRDLAHPLPEGYHQAVAGNSYHRSDVRRMDGIATGSVDLIVTSPPFLDKVDYKGDNWMRAWFLDFELEVDSSEVTVTPDLVEWLVFMRDALLEMGRVLKPGGRAVVEVGEVVHGARVTNLEEELLGCLPLDVPGGRLVAESVFLNQQEFTKLSNCWDVANNRKGTNTNRCLVIQKT